MGIKIGTVHITSLYVVDDNSNDWRPARKEGRNDKRWPNESHHDAESVERINRMR